MGNLCCPYAGPLPASLQFAAGRWTGPGTTLEVAENGQVHYSRFDGSTSVEVRGPISRYSEAPLGFRSVLCCCCVTNFVFDGTPHTDSAGRQTITVNKTAMIRD